MMGKEEKEEKVGVDGMTRWIHKKLLAYNIDQNYSMNY
jgi:hypothetical protein